MQSLSGLCRIFFASDGRYMRRKVLRLYKCITFKRKYIHDVETHICV